MATNSVVLFAGLWKLSLDVLLTRKELQYLFTNGISKASMLMVPCPPELIAELAAARTGRHLAYIVVR